ncbi:hypothetical protein BA896_020740 [Janthinobacterium lividum]|uniref:Uncharacterized protein n=1 Tax=Janthinobacterium lividum TaxID=29581 RepID=A0A1E8PJM4_9BURK|nr:hypothetical protein BA896_020740 [Janthinobacterium lividum]
MVSAIQTLQTMSTAASTAKNSRVTAMAAATMAAKDAAKDMMKEGGHIQTCTEAIAKDDLLSHSSNDCALGMAHAIVPSWAGAIVAIASLLRVPYMLQLHRNSLIATALALPLFFFLYATLGYFRPFAIWNWMDIVCEGGTAVMAGIWFLLPSAAVAWQGDEPDRRWSVRHHAGILG